MATLVVGSRYLLPHWSPDLEGDGVDQAVSSDRPCCVLTTCLQSRQLPSKYIHAHATAFFAYRNYLYQTGESTQMAEYLRKNEGRHPQADVTQPPPPAEDPTELPAPLPSVHGRRKFQDRGPPRQDKHVRFKSREGIQVMPQYPTGLPTRNDVHGEGEPSSLNKYSVQDDAYSGPSTSTGTSSFNPLND